MQQQYWRRYSLTPAGLIVGRVEIGPDKIVAIAQSPARMSFCPSCGNASTRVHSHYQRSLADLPAQGRSVEIKLSVRRFRCAQSTCPRKIFVERLDMSIAVPFARRTARMENVVHRLGLALGGRPGHNLAEKLAILVSKDTLLRTVRRRAVRPDWPLRAVGIDDWAWRRGCRYGTVVCDLERRRIVALLPDRQSGTAAAWLRDYPGIDIVARDRGASYGEAASRGAPQAIQVADRWHLVENASTAFLDVVRQHMRAIREVLASTTIDPTALTKAERRQWDGFQRRQETAYAVLELTRKGVTIKQIVRQLGLARKTVRRIVRGGGTDISKSASAVSNPISQSSMHCGTTAAATALNSGAAYEPAAFRDLGVSWPNGQPGAASTKPRGLSRDQGNFHQRARLPGSSQSNEIISLGNKHTACFASKTACLT